MATEWRLQFCVDGCNLTCVLNKPAVTARLDDNWIEFLLPNIGWASLNHRLNITKSLSDWYLDIFQDVNQNRNNPAFSSHSRVSSVDGLNRRAQCHDCQQPDGVADDGCRLISVTRHDGGRQHSNDGGQYAGRHGLVDGLMGKFFYHLWRGNMAAAVGCKHNAKSKSLSKVAHFTCMHGYCMP